MNCNQFKKSISELVEGNIDKEIQKEMEKHMEGCITCKKEYEDTKFIIESLKKDASSIILNDKQKKEVKAQILKAPIKKYRDVQRILKSFTYAAVFFMCVTAGIYFAGGININIGPSENINTSLQLEMLQEDNNKLRAENLQLINEKKELEKYIKELESGKNKSWMMINPNIEEAIIEGRIISIDNAGKKIKLDIYRDDNTPDIDPNIYIPDGIMISRVPGGGGENIDSMFSGSIKDFSVADHITLHYIGKLKAARAVILYEKGL